MTKKVTLVIGLLALVFSAPAFAGKVPVSVFGPKQYVKAVGKPLTYTDTFTLPAGVDNCRLVVVNGLDGSKEVQNVYVSVNGVQIFGHRDFKQAGSAQSEVALGANNTISVTLQGQGSAFVTVEIIGEKEAVVAPAPPVSPPPTSPPPKMYF